MAGYSLLVRRETIRRIASSGSIPTDILESSPLAVMVDGVNAAIDGMTQAFAEACRSAMDTTAKTIDDAVRGVDVVALRVAQEISPVWYRMTPEVRVPLLGVGVTILFAWVIHMCYVAAMNLQKPRLSSKDKTAALSVSGTMPRTSEKCEPLSPNGSFPPSPVEIDGQGSFDSQDSAKLTERKQTEDFISTSGVRRRKASEEPNGTEDSSGSEDDEDELSDEVDRLLTSKNHSSDSPLEKAGANDLVEQKGKATLAPVTPQPSRSGRRRSSTTSSAKALTLGSTMTPAGVRQSARIRSSRKLP